MARQNPATDIDPRFSSPGASPTPWSEAREHLESAQIYWLTTVRPDGRPHVTPLIAAWLDGALYFSTGATERKARNLESNPHVAITTGCNSMGEGLDLVVEGGAVLVFEIAPATAFGFGRGEQFSQTRWRFA